MDKLKEAVSELESVDPREWLNIPKPIVHGVLILKSCAHFQSQFLETLNKSYIDFESRCNHRILNVQKAISESTEKSKDSDETFKSLVQFSELRINDKTDNFMKKVTEDLYVLKCSTDARISELKESIQDCSKKIDLLPTHQQVQSLILAAGEKQRERILQEVKEAVVGPEISSLSQKIHLQHV